MNADAVGLQQARGTMTEKFNLPERLMVFWPDKKLDLVLQIHVHLSV